MFQPARVSQPTLDRYLPHQSACFLLYDLTAKQLIQVDHEVNCSKRMAPDSTFKIPLSLMAFDQAIINQVTHFKWDRQPHRLKTWDHEQTPKSWLTNSVVWVSQQLTPKLGLDKIQYYLSEFEYGNQDFIGHSGLHDGLTQAWLSSSLQLSANE